jgi:hypothetical protein
MPRFEVNRPGKQIGTTLRPRGRRSGTGQVDSLWRGVNTPDAVEFIAVGGGGNGGGGNWTNDSYGCGAGGGGQAAGILSSPSSGTITVGAAANDSSCFGNIGYKGGNGGERTPYVNQIGIGGTRTTAGGGNGGNGGLPGVNGSTSSITGSSVYYGGGGGSAGYHNVNPNGGLGGGGSGGSVTGVDWPTGGGVNTGGGGGGNDFGPGAAGGSGIVILKYADTFPEMSSIDPGLTYTVSVSGGFRLYTFTAGTGTVSF